MIKDHSIRIYVNELKKRKMIKDYNLYGQEDAIITSITYDSRKVRKGTLFICKGAGFKEEYVQQFVENEAAVYISETKYETKKEIPYIIVHDVRKAMSVLANMFYDHPWKNLKMIAFGGTKGKSTSAFYMKAVIDDYMEDLGEKDSAILSSIEMYDGKTRKNSHITTPESVELQGYLRNACDHGMKYAQMEVSSQALKYGRVDGMMFDIGVFLNISEDHISPIEHKDFEDYFSSKMLMFSKTKTAIVNLDTEGSERILKEAEASRKVITFSTKNKDADFYAYNIHKKENDIIFSVKCRQFDEQFLLTMPGLFNVENAVSVIASAVELKIPLTYIKSGLKRARSKGRMELFSSEDNKIIAIVDFAHNKLSFEKLFASMKEEYPEYRITAVFGCPGNKAYNRRRDMGTVAGQYADQVYIVPDDPAFESAEDISKEIAEYVKAEGCPYEIIDDRGKAVQRSIAEVKEKTLLIVAGKGHEGDMKYGSEYMKYPSDVENVKRYIAEYDMTHSL